jgi:hypothetical protein
MSTLLSLTSDSSFLLQLGKCVYTLSLPTDIPALSGILVSSIAMGDVRDGARF